MPDMRTDERFESWVRFALRNLYDSRVLEDSPLVNTLGLSGSGPAALVLRQALINTIHSLEPDPEIPADSQDWRVYQILLYRYLQRCSQMEVASQLGLSIRHLRREESKAICELVRRLMEPLDLHAEHDLEEMHNGEAEDSAKRGRRRAVEDDELAWLKESVPEGHVELQEELKTVLQLVEPLATQCQVRIEVSYAEGVPPVAIRRAALRHALLGLLTMAIRECPRQSLMVSASQSEQHIQLTIQGNKSHGQRTAESIDSLRMAKRLMALGGGHLVMNENHTSFSATIRAPIPRQETVLVIDDNRDARQLLQRYAVGTEYQVFGAENLEEALARVQEIDPKVIVLDLMMPKVDGWDTLACLRHHPLTSEVPIIVCTVLAEEELARSLGAAAFVRKPISRQAFLAILDRVVGREERGHLRELEHNSGTPGR